MRKTPCFVITRDRVSYTKLCVESLERFADQLEIHLVDHGSTWPAMLDYLHKSPHPVHYMGSRPPRALWEDQFLADVANGRAYLATDPDLVFDVSCPDDWLDKLRETFTNHPGLTKVGLGLRIDDLPPILLSERVRNWEGMFWQNRLDENAWHAPTDTTLALYSGTVFSLGPSARLDAPYLLRHLPWYGESGPEIQYYREHLVPGSSHWIGGGSR